MSENKDISSSESLLPENAIAILNKAMSEGYRNDYLHLYSNNINDSMMPELCELIAKLDDKVKTIDLSENRITSVGASMLFDTLKAADSSIKEVNLNGNKEIDNKCMKSLGEYIKSNKSIQTIKLRYTSISDAGIAIIAPYLDGNTTFKELYLNYNKGITEKSIPLLMKLIKSSCIEHVGIYDTSITQNSTIYVLSVCNRIKNGPASLDLSFKWLNDDDLIKICDAMKKYGIDKLRIKYLHHNSITSKGASLLLNTLKECNSIVSLLNLSSNQLDDKCMKQLGEYIQDSEHVKELIIGSNKITDKGIEILSEYLIGNIILNELNLSSNEEITDASVPHLFEMINKSHISKMDLYGTSISKKKRQEIQNVLSIPIDQREIPIKSNTKSAAKISAST